jgi:hypothetical protein
MISFHDDSVLSAEIVRGQFMRLPQESFTGRRKELDHGKFFPVLDSLLLQHIFPNSNEELSVVVIEETDVSQEGTGKEDVTQH